MTESRAHIYRCSTKAFLKSLDRLTARDITVRLSPFMLAQLVGDDRRAGVEPGDMARFMSEAQYHSDYDGRHQRYREQRQEPATGRNT
jgi:hypothetical protein